MYIGAEGGTLLHFAGGKWTSSVLLPGELDIYALWGSGADNVWALGEDGEARRFDGLKWTKISTGQTESIISAWGSGPNDIWAGLATFGPTSLLHWDGATWKGVQPPVQDFYRGVWCDAPNNFWAVTEDGSILRYDGNAWALDKDVGVGLWAIRKVQGTLYAVGLESNIWFRRD